MHVHETTHEQSLPTPQKSLQIIAVSASAVFPPNEWPTKWTGFMPSHTESCGAPVKSGP